MAVGVFGGRTSGTRIGNGAGGIGWGGPAKGAGAPPGGKGRPKGVKDGEGKRSVADLMAAADARQIAADAWLAILRDPTHPKHAEMVAKAADRMDGAPVARVELRDVDPETMTDEELLAIAKRGRGTLPDKAGDPG